MPDGNVASITQQFGELRTVLETKHNEFVKRMLARGYTQRQVRRLVEWYMRVNKAG